MKSLIFIIPAILALSCGSNGSEEENSVPEITVEETAPEEVITDISETDTGMMYVLRNESVGLFEIGITQEKVEELAPVYSNVEIAEIDLMTEGMPAPALQLTFDNSGVIILQINESDLTVYRIEVYSDLFTTEEGIGIGSSYDDLESNYAFDGIAWGDDGNPLVIVPEAGMSFLIEPGDWWQTGNVEGDIPGDTEVTAIILW